MSLKLGVGGGPRAYQPGGFCWCKLCVFLGLECTIYNLHFAISEIENLRFYLSFFPSLLLPFHPFSYSLFYQFTIHYLLARLSAPLFFIHTL